MGRVPNEQFVKQLTGLIANSAAARSVYISKKRYSRGGDGLGDASMSGPDGSDVDVQFPILIRVTDGREDKGKRAKFSTLVAPADLAAFEALYLPALRNSLSASLRKRDKAKERKVDKLIVAARRKIEEQGGKVPLKGVGSKRGAGHRKRQRTAKRAAKARRDKAVQASKDGAGASSSTPVSVGAAESASTGAGRAPAPNAQSSAPASKAQAKGGKGKGGK